MSKLGAKYMLNKDPSTAREVDKFTLYPIVALRDFKVGESSVLPMEYRTVKKGEKGGWLESEDNLSQDGNCWVGVDSQVYDKAVVSGEARVIRGGSVHGYGSKVSGVAIINGYHSRVQGGGEVHDAIVNYGLVGKGGVLKGKFEVSGCIHNITDCTLTTKNQLATYLANPEAYASKEKVLEELLLAVQNTQVSDGDILKYLKENPLQFNYIKDLVIAQ